MRGVVDPVKVDYIVLGVRNIRRERPAPAYWKLLRHIRLEAKVLRVDTSGRRDCLRGWVRRARRAEGA